MLKRLSWNGHTGSTLVLARLIARTTSAADQLWPVMIRPYGKAMSHLQAILAVTVHENMGGG